MRIEEAAVRPATATSLTRSAAWDVGRSSGSLIVAWQNPESRLIASVGLLEHGLECGYRFRYLRRAVDVEGFVPFLSFPDWERTYTSQRLFPLFSQRIMSPRRPDFSEFLRQLHLSEDATPWEQLARSEGRSTGDTVQVFPIPAVRPDGTTTCRFLVHGIRYVASSGLSRLTSGDPLTLRDEPENPVNTQAVLVCTHQGEPLGYVPDLLLEHLRVLQGTAPVELTVEHINGPEAPVHLRLLVRLDGEAPAGYRPMSGSNWQTF